MARGYVYELKKNPQDICLSEDDLYEYAGHEADYFRDLSRDEQGSLRVDLMNQFQHLGAEVGVENGIPYIIFSNKVKETYFMPQYKEFIELTKDMSINTFINKAWELKNAIENTYEDLAYNDYLQSMDHFMRECEPDVKYYIGNIVLAH